MKKTTIAKKLTVYFVFLSLLIGTIGTTISLFRDYQNYKKQITKRFKQIQETILPALGSALFNEDDDQIKQSIEGILNTEDMVYLEIYRVYEEVTEKKPSFKKGVYQKLNTISSRLKIFYKDEGNDHGYDDGEVGEIFVVASLKSATTKIKDQIKVFVIIQAFQFLLLTVMMLYLFKSLVSKHLSRMAIFAEGLDLANLSGSLLLLDRKKEKFEDELDTVVNSLNIMKKNLKDTHSQLKDYSLNLESMVREKTQELELEKMSIENMMDQTYERKKSRDLLLGSLSQGYLTFSREGIIHEGATKVTEELLETTLFESEVEGFKIWDTLFKEQEKKDNFKKWVDKVFDGGFSFKDLIQLAPKTFEGTKGKHIVLEFRPIYQEDSKSKVDKVIMIASDKTNELKLEKQLLKDKENIEFVSKCLQNPLEFVDLIFDTTALTKDPEFLKFEKPSDKEEVFRRFHTTKARFGQFGLKSLTAKINDIESAISEEDFDKIFSCVEKLDSDLQKFLTKNRLIVEAANKFLVDEGAAIQVPEIIQKAKEFKVNDEYLEFIKNEYLLSDIKPKFERYIPLVDEIAVRQGKAIDMEISGDKILVDTNNYSSLINTSIHIFRNMVDHGIEPEEERIEKSKPQKGVIKVRFVLSGERFNIILQDDGKGIDPAIIKEKIFQKKLKSDEEIRELEDSEIIEMIFIPGFSTKEEVTAISGRGVGMDAIKTEVEKLGGAISVSSKLDEGTKFIIELPILK